MAAVGTRTADEIRRELERERQSLTEAVANLRLDLNRAIDVPKRISANLPVAMLCTAAVGFVLAGGIGATARFFARRGRDGRR